jgi:hypothetical protein
MKDKRIERMMKTAAATADNLRHVDLQVCRSLMSWATRQVAAARALPLSCGETCLTRRALVAAQREAEQAGWMQSGGDFLSSVHRAIP